MTQAAPANYVWWLAGRSAGMVAMLLIAASVILGLAMAAKAIPQRWRKDAVGVHQHLAMIGLGAIAAHGLLLAADPWLKAGWKGILVPFAIGYRPLWTGLGILGGYLAAILALSFYVRRRIGVRLWRRMHRFTVVVYVLSLVHALGSGTDASIPVVRYAMLASTLPIVFLFALRMLRGGRRPAAAPRQTPAAVQRAARGQERSGEGAAAKSGSPAPGRRPGGLAITAARGHMDPQPSQAS
jgi:methionine sulfoxide reductase heme-binding subunit